MLQGAASFQQVATPTKGWWISSSSGPWRRNTTGAARARPFGHVPAGQFRFVQVALEHSRLLRGVARAFSLPTGIDLARMRDKSRPLRWTMRPASATLLEKQGFEQAGQETCSIQPTCPSWPPRACVHSSGASRRPGADGVSVYALGVAAIFGLVVVWSGIDGARSWMEELSTSSAGPPARSCFWRRSWAWRWARCWPPPSPPPLGPERSSAPPAALLRHFLITLAICVVVFAVTALIPTPNMTPLPNTELSLWLSFLPLALVGC
jgi:hypothetical protein